MDVDKLFKLPKVPQSSLNKRKWAEPSKANLQSYRSGEGEDEEREEGRSAVAGPSRPVRKAARVSEGNEGEEGEEDDGKFAPGNDADYFVDEDDDGGRFFGGGLTTQQKRILEIMNNGAAEDENNDDADETKPEEQLRSFRRSLVKLERAINKNQEMRVRFADDPSKYIHSEADLDAAIKGLVLATTNPALFYPEMIKHGTVSSLCNLLSHENVDIAATVIELLEEMTDDDVQEAGVEDTEAREREIEEKGYTLGKNAEVIASFYKALVDESLPALLIQSLLRFKEEEPSATTNGDKEGQPRSSILIESDMSAVYRLLGLVENLISHRTSSLPTFMLDPTMVDWLLKRMSKKGKMDQNKAYAAEVLGIMLNSAVWDFEGEERERFLGHFADRSGITVTLELIAAYRKGDPKDDDEVEYMENLFDILCCALYLPRSKEIFYKEEGTELMCILMKGRGVVRLRAIKALSHAFSGPYGSANCVRFIDNQGLKPFFGTFTGKAKQSSHAEPTHQDEEYMLQIITSLLNNLKSDSIERIRYLSKFVEKDYEKVDRLLEMRSALVSRIDNADLGPKRNVEEMDVEEKDLFYLNRTQNGLYSLQLVDYSLAWLVMEDDGILAHVQMMFSRTGMKMDNVIDNLKEYHEYLLEDTLVALPEEKGSNGAGKGEKKEEDDEEENDDGLRLRDVLVSLVNYLLSV